MQSETDFDLMNGVLAARRKAPELDIVIDLIISNILKQEIRESETSAHVPYSLFGMTGTYTFVQSFFDQSPPRPRLKKEFESTIFVHYMKDNRKSGFALAEYYTYRRPGNHWSEREKNERFFLDSPALAVHSNPCAISTSSGHGLARAESAMLAETLPPRDAPPCSASDLSFQGVVDELSAPPCATPNALESDGNTDTNSATSSDLLRPEAERDQMQMSDDGRGNPQARIRQLETMSLPTNTPTCPDGQPHEWEAGTTLIFYCKRCTQLKQVLPYSLVFD
ncbi:MAG: hypothetical protein M1423_05430 [Acidobacteria bacterium]|nr:hypothetical protein [Acidobacteriota bacterium]